MGSTVHGSLCVKNFLFLGGTGNGKQKYSSAGPLFSEKIQKMSSERLSF
jgi:hypothetical protein